MNVYQSDCQCGIARQTTGGASCRYLSTSSVISISLPVFGLSSPSSISLRVAAVTVAWLTE